MPMRWAISVSAVFYALWVLIVSTLYLVGWFLASIVGECVFWAYMQIGMFYTLDQQEPSHVSIVQS
jgi:hypothetical protein